MNFFGGASKYYDPFTQKNSEKVKIKSLKTVRDNNDNCDYVVHKLEKVCDNGDRVTFYKASKFFKLVRVSKASKDNTKIMSIQADIMRGLYSSDISIIQIVANVLTPEPVGLIYLYGAQAVGETENIAIERCKADYKAFLGAFKGTHRTAHLEVPKRSEMSWIVKKIKEQKYVSYVKGIPAPRASQGGTPKRNSLLNETTSSTEEQMEQFLTGMTTDEFVLMITATPVEQQVLRGWLNKSLKEATKWESMKTGTNSFSAGISIPMTMGASSGTSLNSSDGTSATNSLSASETLSDSQSSAHSTSTSVGNTSSDSTGQTTGTTSSDANGTGSSVTNTTGGGTTTGETIGGSVTVTAGTGNKTILPVSAQVGVTGSYNHSNGSSTQFSNATGTTENSTHTEGNSASNSNTHSDSTSNTRSQSDSDTSTTGHSTAKTAGLTNGTTRSNSYGTNNSSTFSGGLSPSVSIGKTYQFTDKQVEYLCTLLNAQNERLANSTEGEGMFYVDFYISAPDLATQKEISTLVDTAWINNDSKIDILRGIIPKNQPEMEKLAMHMLAFSPCLDMEQNRNGKYYKYSSLLQSSELAAYTHPPRISAGGIDAAMEDRPRMRVPIDRQSKEIFMGYVVNGERYSIEQYAKYGNGYQTDYKFCLGANELHHAVISGSSGSGKSVLATRLVSELYNNTETVDKLTGTHSKKRILILDPKGEWRQMCYVVPPEKYRFFSIGDPSFHPLKLNLLRCPKYISGNDWFNMVVEHFCSAYGLADRALAQISDGIYRLYDQNDVFNEDHITDPDWANERTKNITMEDLYDLIAKDRDAAEKRGEKYNVDALTTYLTRLQMFKFKGAKEHIMFCNKGGMSVEEIIGDDSITVVESNGLSTTAQAFFFTLFMEGVFRFAQGTGGFYREGQYETFIVLEEANTVLCPSGNGGSDDKNGTPATKKFELILDQSRSYGLFIWTITQKVAAMPDSVTANAGLIFAGKSLREVDINVLLKALGFDGKFEDRDTAKWFPRMPIGEFIVKINKGFKEVDQEPVMIKVAPIDLHKPTNEELEVIIQSGEMIRKRNALNNL